jgi:putative aldouronate transport system substrate-binding protein
MANVVPDVDALRVRPETCQSRRGFLSVLTAGAATALGGLGSGCRARPANAEPTASAREISALLPTRRPIVLVKPDIPGEGPIPDGYLHYPASVVRVVQEKPGRGGKPIRTMMPAWGPTPPGRGRNSYIDAVNAELGVAIDPSLQDGMTFAAKLSAMLGARDVPDILAAPNWEIAKIPRFSQAVKALFADLTEYLQGDAASAYPRLATLPTGAWRYSIWGGRLAAIPYPADGPFPWAFFYRKDLCDRAGVAAPKTLDELYSFGKAMTDPRRGVWAFGLIFEMVQMYFKCPGVQRGWREKPGGGLVFKYELPEYREALAFATRLHREGFVHPDVIENNGSDAKLLFNAGKLIAYRDGPGTWRGVQSEQAKITPGFNMQPIPLFSAVGGDPLVWTVEEPIFYTFIKRGLSRERTEELLRVLDWCAAPLGSFEHQLNEFGVEGQHFSRMPDGSPMRTELGRKEWASQYAYIGGRVPTLVATSDVPNYVQESIEYTRTTYAFREPDPFSGIKIELPPNYSRVITPTEDKINDIVRGRRPLGDLEQIVNEWRRSGGDEGRKFYEKVLADSRQ